LKENIKKGYKEMYLEITSLFTEPMTQPTTRQPAPLHEDATEDDESKVKSVKDYEAKADAHDCLWLLQQVKAITMNYKARRTP